MPKPSPGRDGTCEGRPAPLGMRREIKLPVEIKPEQVKAGFENGILTVHLPKLVVVNAQRVPVD